MNVTETRSVGDTFSVPAGMSVAYICIAAFIDCDTRLMTYVRAVCELRAWYSYLVVKLRIYSTCRYTYIF